MPAAEWARLAPWERYRMRVHAVAQTWRAPVFCLESAAVEHDLPLVGEPREIHLVSVDGKTWRQGDVHVHGWREERPVTAVGGLRVATLEDTTTDLCRVLPPAFALAVADAALRRMAEDGDGFDILAHGAGQPNRRGLRQLAWVRARATPLAESSGESVSRAVIEWLGFDPPDLQHEFRYEGATDRSDFYWPAARIIGESDGYGKYDADNPATMKAHFIREKQREDRLRRYERGFARWDWGDAMRGAPLGAKLHAAGLTASRHANRTMLATLASHPRSIPRTRGNAANPTT